MKATVDHLMPVISSSKAEDGGSMGVENNLVAELECSRPHLAAHYGATG